MLIVSIVVVLLMLVDRFEDVDGLKCWVKVSKDQAKKTKTGEQEDVKDDNSTKVDESKPRVEECNENACSFRRKNGEWDASGCAEPDACKQEHIPITSDCSEMMEMTMHGADGFKAEHEMCCCTTDKCNKAPFGHPEAWGSSTLIVAALFSAIWQL